MPHSIWTGAISFGLVTIPVSLHAAENRRELSFHMLDRRDMQPVKQMRVNPSTGEEVPWEEVVKGYEIEKGRWVVLDEPDFRAADVEATQTIDILAFVPAGAIGPEYFERPYWLEPLKPGRKAYALLRETLARSGRVGIAKVVIRTRQHIATVAPEGEALVLDLLRWPHELHSAEKLDLPSADLAEAGVTDAELKMAATLVDAMAADWEPEAYRDTYHDALLALIQRKAKEGAITAPPPPPDYEHAAEVVDIMALLKRSVEEAPPGKAAES